MPNEIGAALDIRSHHLTVRITYSRTAFMTRIARSSNLDQSDTRIHKNALVWVNELNQRVRLSLSALSTYKASEEVAEPTVEP